MEGKIIGRAKSNIKSLKIRSTRRFELKQIKSTCCKDHVNDITTIFDRQLHFLNTHSTRMVQKMIICSLIFADHEIYM